MRADGPEFRTFDSFEEADQASFEYYRSLSPNERIEVGLQMMQGLREAYPRLERIYRTAELGECPVSSDPWMEEVP